MELNGLKFGNTAIPSHSQQGFAYVLFDETWYVAIRNKISQSMSQQFKEKEICVKRSITKLIGSKQCLRSFVIVTQ